MSGRRMGPRGMAVALAACLLALAISPCPAAAGETREGANGPRLLRASPDGGEEQGRDAAILLSFDRPMQLESLARAASFDPPLPFTVSGEAECLFLPDNLLSPGIAYTFRLAPGVARDLAGAAFDGEVELAFITRGDGVTVEVPGFSFRGEVIEGHDPQGVAGVISSWVGHYPGTGRPGAGNYVIMAHASGRVEFPFNAIFDLGAGETFTLSYGGRDYLYSLRESRVVEQSEMWILDPTAHPSLTVFVCSGADGRPSPTFRPPYRLMVRAVLIEARPRHPRFARGGA